MTGDRGQVRNVVGPYRIFVHFIGFTNPVFSSIIITQLSAEERTNDKSLKYIPADGETASFRCATIVDDDTPFKI